MRVSAVVLALAISAPAATAGPVPVEPSEKPRDRTNLDTQEAERCPRTASYYARQRSLYRGAPLTPEKLTELPPATGYMAVYRRIDGCEVPMTVVEYRTGRRP